MRTNPRSQEITVRRAAERQGYRLRGSRRKDRNVADYGMWRIETQRGVVLVQGDLDRIERWVYHPDQR